MANCSDAFGDIVVKKVGKEFIEFIKEVEGENAYYELVGLDNLERAELTEDGDLVVSFSVMGRWHYGNNVRGYLEGDWMTDEKQSKAHDKLYKALIEKDGLIDVSYTDSDSAMDWMGTGGATLQVIDGEVSYSDIFDEQPITISGYADLYGYDEQEALEMLMGDEVAEKYNRYEEACKEKGEVPESPDSWYDTIYEEE